MCQILPNGPAVVLVNVAERPEGVGRIISFRHGFHKHEGSEARRGFCRHGINFLRTCVIAVQTLLGK